MRPTNKIGNSHEEEMSLILEFILDFDVNRLLYAINGKQMREEDIISITIDIQEYYAKLSRQKVYLFRFGQTFNQRFTTEDNKCFDTSLKTSRRMRSGFTGIKKAIFKPFVKVSRKRLPDGTPNPSIKDRSMISTANYCADLYGLSSYPNSVKDLFRVMLQFYEIVDECIAECMRILKEEKELKADGIRCLDLLIEACEKSKKNQLHIIEAIESDPCFREAVKNSPIITGDENNPVLTAFKKNSMSKGFAQAFIHNCTFADVGKITLYQRINEADIDPMLMLAHTVFGNDDDKIKRINYIINHFDELLPTVCKRSTIPAYYLFVFMEWCGNIIGVDSFLKYFKKYYQSHGGKWKVVGKSAINSAKNRPFNIKYKDKCNKIYTAMHNGIKRLLSNFESMEMSA